MHANTINSQPDPMAPIKRRVSADIVEKRKQAALAAQRQRGQKLGHRADGGPKVFWKDPQREVLAEQGALLFLAGFVPKLSRRTLLTLLRKAQDVAIDKGLLKPEERRNLLTTDPWFPDLLDQHISRIRLDHDKELRRQRAQERRDRLDRLEEQIGSEPDTESLADGVDIDSVHDEPAEGGLDLPPSRGTTADGRTFPREHAAPQIEERAPQQAAKRVLGPTIRQAIVEVLEIFAEVFDIPRRQQQDSISRSATTTAASVSREEVAASTPQEPPPPNPKPEDLRPPPIRDDSGTPLVGREARIQRMMSGARITREMAEKIVDGDTPASDDQHDDTSPQVHANGASETLQPESITAEHEEEQAPQRRRRHNPEMLPDPMPRAKQPIVLVVGLTARQQQQVEYDWGDKVQLKAVHQGEKVREAVARTADLVIVTGLVPQTPRKILRELVGKEKYKETEGGQLVEGVDRLMTEYLNTPNLEDVIAAGRANAQGNGNMARFSH